MAELKIDAEDPATPWEEWSEVEQLRYRLRRALEDRDILFTGRLEVMAENAGLREALEAARPVVDAAVAAVPALRDRWDAGPMAMTLVDLLAAVDSYAQSSNPGEKS